MKNLFVLVPAYNEEKMIGNAIKALISLKQFFKENNLDLSVVVIDDGSVDKTKEEASQANVDHIVSHSVNQGLGAAINTGLKFSQEKMADIVVKFDADLQHNPNDIKKLIDPILEAKADIVYGHRFNNINYKMPFVRRVGNLVFTGLMRWLTNWPIYDSQPGILAVNKRYLKVFYLPGTYNYTQQILLDAHHNGLKFAAVDVEFNKRVTGKSFISYKYPFKVIPQLVSVIVGVKPLKFFGPISVLFLALALAVFVYDISCFFKGINPRPVAHSNLVLGTSIFGMQTLFFGILADLIVHKVPRK
tara:strand:+ start:4907 stop:5815 length:909 start_codon:yes stop_codon:yes gene_type:complete